MRGFQRRLGRHRAGTKLFEAVCEPLETRRLLSAAPVTITTVANASEAGPTTGSVRVRRVGDNSSSPLSVTLRFTGTATYGSDYTLPSTPTDHKITVTIPAGEASTLVTVSAIDDALVEGTETVIVTAVAPPETTYDPGASATLTIADNDQERPPEPVPGPVAHANGPYSVPEGKAETLHGTATVGTGRTIVSYQWDFNYDGLSFDVDAQGASPKFNAALIDGVRGGTVRTIALRVLDSAGVASPVSTSTVTIKNAAPTARLVGSTVTAGQSGTVSFREINDVPADVNAGFTFRYDFNSDGIIDLVSHSPTATVPASFLMTVGEHRIRASIQDKDEGTSTYVTTIVVKRKEPERTPTPPPVVVVKKDKTSDTPRRWTPGA